MTEADSAAIEAALESNPMAIAEAEGHLKKGLMILSQIGIDIGFSHLGLGFLSPSGKTRDNHRCQSADDDDDQHDFD